MGSLNPFKKPKMPAPVVFKPAPLPPIVQEPITQEAKGDDIDASIEEQKERLRKQRGRAATILTRSGATGDDSTGVATKRLLGS